MNGTELINMVEVIKKARKLLNITQYQLAEKSGLSYSTISKIEAGAYNLTPDSQTKIITVLTNEGFDINALIQLSQLVKKQGAKGNGSNEYNND